MHEKEEGLPVHRHSHKSRSSVYAYRSEIDAWRASRKTIAEPAPAPFWRSLLPPARPLAFGVTLMLCLVMVGNGIRPQGVSAQARPTLRQIWKGDAGESRISLSADGRFLTFVDRATADLGIRDLATNMNRMLTSGAWKAGAYVENSVISPDNRYVAYLWHTITPRSNEVRLVRADGSAAPRTLHRIEGGGYVDPVGWAPDGKHLLVVSSRGDQASYQIGMLSVQDGTVRGIKSLGWVYPVPKLSPDGRYIAYALAPDDKTQATDVYVIATDGSREFAAAQGPSNDVPMAWSPDGSRLLYLSDRTGRQSLWSLPVQSGKPGGGAAEMIKAEVGSISKPLEMARNGAFHFVTDSRSRTNIYRVDLGPGMKAAADPVLVTERFMNSNFGTSLSPDGRYLAYYSHRPAGPRSDHVLVIRTLETDQERDVPLMLPVRSTFFYGPMWFPDGRSALVTFMEPQKPYLTFYHVDLTTGEAERLHHRRNPIQGFRLSPDGKAIYYSDLTTLTRFDIATRTETVLRKGGVINTLAVSPDSKQLAYLLSAGAEASLVVMPATGGEERKVFRVSDWRRRYNGLTWSPDQRLLLFARGESGTGPPWPSALWQVQVTEGEPQPLGVSMKAGIHFLQAHPGGRQLFFSTDEDAVREVWALDNFLPQVAVGK